MSDATNPSHYKDGWSNGAEVVDIAENLTSNGGQAVQYIARSTRLDGNNKGDVVEDLEKARWFINRELDRVQGVPARHYPAWTCSEGDFKIPEDDEFFIEHMTAPVQPRVWDSLEDVPINARVRSQGGEVWRFWISGERDDEDRVVTSAVPGEWLHSGMETIRSMGLYKTGPFTEVVE